MAPSLDAERSSYLEPHEWLMTVSHRFFHSFRDYQGGKELPFPSPPEYYAQTRVHTFDVSLTHAFTKRLSMTLELPFEKGSRETYFEHDGVSRHTMRAAGLQDVRLIGNFWLLDPDKNPHQNVSVSVGVKAPTGDSGATDVSYRGDARVVRPVDPAIQPGDGGWGLVLGTQAFKRLSKHTFVYLQGTYLSNPREMNGTQTPFGDQPAITGGDIGYIVDSVPDQYLGQIGITQTVWVEKRLSLTFGVRIDGVPSLDLIGGSEGWRLPGYNISLEPGLAISRGRNSFSFTVPVAVKSHGGTSLADARTHSPFAGIVSLADSQITFNYSRRF